MKVYLVLDHEDYTYAVFSSHELAQAYIDRELADYNDWQLEVYGWKVVEFEVNKEPEND